MASTRLRDESFTLSLRHGGRVRNFVYVGGIKTCFHNMDVNEWGLFTLRYKVKELGYDIDNVKMFSSSSNGLTELISDSEIWDLVKQIELQNGVEIWVVTKSDERVEDSESDAEWEAEQSDLEKGTFGGQLLLAIGVDGNDSVFPLAYAIVEGERKESWTWFLENLKRDLKITEQDELKLTFISDKQKGLLPAFEDVLPRAKHRFCVQHLHGNMKLAGFTGKAIKDALWDAARAITMNTFKTAMEKMKEIDAKAYEWLCGKHPSEWSRSYFGEIANCDMLVNNICESYNSVILKAREQPLISCLETLRKLLMARFYECRKQALKWNGPICPTIEKKIGKIEKQAGAFTVIQCDDNLFEVREAIGQNFEQHEVDLVKMTCTCRSWQLTGIPCRHGISAIWKKKGKGPVHDFVHHCYFVRTYLNSYRGSIKPMAGPEEWPISEREPPLPPLYNRKAGRPSKLRKKSGGEDDGQKKKCKDGQKSSELSNDGVHLKRKFVEMHCSICNKGGHNKRRCPEDPVVKEILNNSKKRVRVRIKKGHEPARGTAHHEQLPAPDEHTRNSVDHEVDDQWLANIDMDAVVSQFLQPHVTGVSQVAENFGESQVAENIKESQAYGEEEDFELSPKDSVMN